MTAYLGGDAQAFRLLFERYAPQLERMLRRYVLDADDARDLVQQTFLQVHRARHDFKQGAKIRPWLVTIAFNLGRDLGRKRTRKRETELSEEPVDEGRSPEDAAHATQERRNLERAIASLNPAQREAVVLHWFEGHSFEEIAAITGTKATTVKVRAHRAYGALRTYLNRVTETGGAT